MTPDRWAQVEELYHAAFAQPAEARAAFLAEACPDLDVRRDVESLLAQSASGELATGGAAAFAPDLERAVTGSSLVGRRVGVYEIRALVGIGGMGEVYRARDTRLGRDVAIKTLPQAFTSDPERLARFEREARVLASLNHPNIATIHGLEEGDGVRALVMELVDGPTLAERVAQGPMPMTQALTIAHQIAEALEAAHEKGIVHRDLKPANIKLTREGTVKVLDFGLAKVYLGDAPGIDLSQIPTVTATDLQAGRLVGTPAYMSPEQARGQTADKRTDIWAFACVLYEILTGRSAFAGNTVSDTIARILEREPDWSALPATLPVNVRRLLRRCLEKDLGRRQRDIGDARIELDDISAQELTSPVSAAATRHSRIGWPIAALVSAAVVAAIALSAREYFGRAPEGTRVYRSTLVMPPEATAIPPTDAGFRTAPRRFALSPDGRHLAFIAADEGGRPMLWVRTLDTLVAQPLAGTEDAITPFWSADSRFIGFFTPPQGGTLKKIDIQGGPPEAVCEFFGQPTGATWNREGTILFSTGGGSDAGPIRRVSASGGTPSIVATPDQTSGETAFWSPFFLPDGQHFLYLALTTSPTPPGIYVASLDSNDRKLLARVGSNAKYSQGYLLFMRQATLVAQAFNVGRLELLGDAMPVADQVLVDSSAALVGSGAAVGAFTVSDSGALVYEAEAGTAESSQLAWFDRTGKQLAILGDQANYADLSLSSDGTRLAVTLPDPNSGNRDLWIYEVARGLRTRFTFGPGSAASSMWSADGSRIVYNARQGARFDLYQKPSSGAGNEQVFLSEGDFDKYPYGWTPDGGSFLYASGNNTPGTGNDLYILPLAGDRKPLVYLKTRFNEGFARLSPDGRWIAYTSNESGRNEVYVAPFPKPGGKWQISTSGGTQARWRRDGREIFYISLENKLVSVEVNGQGAGLEVGALRQLFQTRLTGARYEYDVTGDGQRFVINTAAEHPAQVSLTLVSNWGQALKSLVPTR